MKVKSAVITAAGFGTRFLPVVKSVPKEMLVIIDKPIIQYLVEECVEAGIENIIIVVRKGNHIIEDYFCTSSEGLREFLQMMGKEERFASVEDVLNIKGVKVVEQDPALPYGNGSPVLSAKNYLPENEPFALLFGDDMVIAENRGALGQLVDYYDPDQMDSVLGVQVLPDEELVRYGVIKPKQVLSETSGIMESMIEKPAIDQLTSNMASYGRMVLSYKIFDYLKPDATGKDGELWLQDANARLAENGNVHYKVINGEWMTTGDPIRFFDAQLKYFLMHPEYGPQAKEIIKKLNLQ